MAQQLDLKQYLEEKRAFISAEIEKILFREEVHPLKEIYTYCLATGKRFRPILVMASAEACGADAASVLPAAISIEMIHNFSLIHDDLPCMDNDDMRRGRPSCHARYGQTEALLAGDGMLIFAFQVLSRNATIEGVDPRAVIKVLDLYGWAAGHRGMTGGQVLDMRYQNAPAISRETLENIHRNKTGALITASCMAGGILAGGDDDRVTRLQTYGSNIGLTYQIVDDLLDCGEDKETISFPAVFGIE